jgi:hypothetical protein
VWANDGLDDESIVRGDEGAGRVDAMVTEAS